MGLRVSQVPTRATCSTHSRQSYFQSFGRYVPKRQQTGGNQKQNSAWLVRGCKIIGHVFPSQKIDMVLKAYQSCPYFALMTEAEFDAPVFEECTLGMQLYPKHLHKGAITAFLWHQDLFISDKG